MGMKILTLLLLCSGAASAGWGGREAAEASALASARAEVQVLEGAPLLDLLAERYKAALPVEAGGAKFLATVMFDAEWEEWFVLKPEGCGAAGAWSAAALKAGVQWESGGRKFSLRRDGDKVLIGAAAGGAEVSSSALFDLLYGKSRRVTFGGLVTYAVVRNLEPLSEREGTVTLRRGSDGLYYYSLTPDAAIEREPRWLLAVNGVLYGLRVDAASLLFVAKKIEMDKAPGFRERARPR